MGFFVSTALILASFMPALAHSASISQSAEWKGILQYQKSFLGAERSEIDGQSFFFSEKGMTDPEAELAATLEAFAKPVVKDEKGEGNEHAICKYPARFTILQKHGLLKNLPSPLPNCASYRVYRERIQTRKVSIVFSSYYSGSASSVFGHSFLKFSGINGNELFDTGVNFAANPTATNPVLYALYGMIGVFPSSFSAQPFYFKVREYNDFESRDLWTYDLNLNEVQKVQLVAHLWELGNTYYNYFYFNENCSYQILRAIEGSIPEIRFFSRRPIYLIPSESVKLLDQVPGLVSKVGYRPSIRSVAEDGFDKLNSAEKKELLGNLKNPTQISDSARVVDVLMDAIDLNYADQIVRNDPKIIEWKDRVLKKRASIQEISTLTPLQQPANERPDRGHGTRRISLGYGYREMGGQGESFTDFRARASHHDLLDPSVGYPRHLHIDFGRIGFQYLHQSRRFLFDELTIVDLNALSVDHPLYSKWSYDVKIGYQRRWFADCNDPAVCGAIELKGGIGKTFPLFARNTVFFLMDFAPSFSGDYQGSRVKMRVNPSANFLFEFAPNFKAMTRFSSGYTFFTEHHWLNEASVETRYVFDDRFGLNLEGMYGRQADLNRVQAVLKGMYYF